MDTRKRPRLGLLVRSGPFRGRAARDQLDMALAAASLDFELELYFVGAGVLQLVAERDPHAASLPRGSRGWKSLPSMAPVRAFVTREKMLELEGLQLLLEVDAAPRQEIADRMSACDRLLVV